MNVYADGELIVLLGLVLKVRDEEELRYSRLSPIRFSERADSIKRIAHYETLQKKIGLGLTTTNNGGKHRFSDIDAQEFSALATVFRDEIQKERLEEEVTLKKALEQIIGKVDVREEASEERELVG